MRFGFSLIALVAATFAAAQPSISTRPSINPDPSVAHPIADVDVSTPSAETNAKRFAKGLPPLSPKAHRRRPNRLSPHGGTGVDTARRATTSPVPPVSTKCNILVKSADTTYGYLKAAFNVFGEYGTFQSEQDGALEVSFSYSPDSPSQIDFVATNTPSASFPYVGAAVGFASDSNDFASGSFNYAYVAGTEQFPAGPAVAGDNNSFARSTGIPADAESAIWTYDPKSNAITAQWINTDNTTPATHLLYANDGNDAILLTGDVDTLNDTFGTEYPEVTFTCVSPVETPAPPVVTPS